MKKHEDYVARLVIVGISNRMRALYRQARREHGMKAYEANWFVAGAVTALGDGGTFLGEAVHVRDVLARHRDRRPEPGDGPDYWNDLASWERRQPDSFIVEDVFEITGRGPVITGKGFPAGLFKPGDVIRCGRTLVAVITGVERFRPHPEIADKLPAGLLLAIEREKLQAGQVWRRVAS